MAYTVSILLILGSWIIMLARIFYHFKNLNKALIPYFKQIDNRKLIWMRSAANIKTTKIYMYAYNNLSELELQAFHKMLKSESKSDNVVNTVIDYLVKIAVPFIISFIGFMFVFPTYIATYSQLADKSNMGQIKEALKETYTELVSSFSVFSFIFIFCLLFFVAIYNFMKRIIKSDIELRIGIIDKLLESKFKYSKLFKEEIRSNQIIDEDWQLDYVKFFGIPLIISNLEDNSQDEGNLKGYSKESIILEETPYNRANYIIKVK